MGKPSEDKLEERVQRLEAELQRADLPLFEWLAAMNQLRELAGRDEAPRRLRLRFAQRWLASRLDAQQIRRGAVDNDRAAYLWSVSAAHNGMRQGQLLLGHCYRHGRGAPQSRSRSRFWYRRAAAAGSSEAEFWLRYTQRPESGWLLYRGNALGWIGLALLALYFIGQPFAVSWLAVGLYIALALLGQLALSFLMSRVAGDQGPRVRSGATVVDGLARRPWELLAVAGEDGLVLVPLLWLTTLLGLPGVLSPLAGLLFGALHYPNFPWRMCAAKGITYAAAVALILPWGGLASVVIGHVLLDAAIVVVRVLVRRST